MSTNEGGRYELPNNGRATGGLLQASEMKDRREVRALRSRVERYEKHLDAHCSYGEDECDVLRDYLTPTVDAPPDCTHDQCAGCRNHQAEGGKGCCGDPSCLGPLTTVMSGE